MMNDDCKFYPSIGKNSLHATIHENKVQIETILGGETRSWILFDLPQMEVLMDHLLKVKTELEIKLGGVP